MIPILVMVYFAYQSIESERKTLNNTIAFEHFAEFTESASELIHQLQIERGFASGFLVYQNIDDREKINHIFKDTDSAYSHFENKAASLKRYIDVSGKDQLMLEGVKEAYDHIGVIRKKILNTSLQFSEVLDYYTQINRILINQIEKLARSFGYIDTDAEYIGILQRLKEYAGLERAHLYYALRTGISDPSIVRELEKMIMLERLLKQYLLDIGSARIQNIFQSCLNPQIEKKLIQCRESVLNHTLNRLDADRCFQRSTAYIDQFKEMIRTLLQEFVAKAKKRYRQALNAMIWNNIIWFFSMTALLFLWWIVYRMMNKAERQQEALRIAAYAFDAQEAMMVTNSEGKLIRVNRAFTEITGYSPEEVLGKNSNILKSDRHEKQFYHKMWKELVNKGRWQGEIYNRKKSGEIYPEYLSITAITDDKGAVTHYIAQFIDLSEIKETQRLLQYQADHDFLTGVLNRRSLMEVLQQVYTRSKETDMIHAFLFVDLDRFKAVNDLHGHYIGDQLLIQVTKEIKQLIGSHDLIARLSGDEFAVLLLDLGLSHTLAIQKVAHTAQSIIDRLKMRHIIDGIEVEIGASIGIRIFPEGEENINDIVLHADKAMYKAKAKGKGQYFFFDESIKVELQRMMQTEKEITEGLDAKLFDFYYQPKVNLLTGEICGAEMLLRWKHPKKGVLLPGDFLDVAQGMGIVHEFFVLALHQACELLQQEKLQKVLAINVDAKEFMHFEFEKSVINIVSQYDINPSFIEFEITETTIIQEFDVAKKRIRTLQEKGFRFSIDDFGTGYSSITYLQQLPVNALKLDRSFFENANKQEGQAVIRMVVDLAKIFHMQIVAEGIETQEHLHFARACGVDTYQGFYFSKAVEKKIFLDMLKENGKQEGE